MKIRVGILGCANIARRSLAPAFAAHEAFDWVAIASRDAAKAEAFVADVRAKGAVVEKVRCCSYDDLVGANDIDLIYCPLPTGLHYDWVLKCLECGKHVLCEKSLACTFVEVQKLVETAKIHGCFLMESFQFRTHQQNLFVRELLERKTLGDVRQIVVRFGFPPFPDGKRNIRYQKDLGGGALFDAGAYTLKAATFLAGNDLIVRDATSWTGSDQMVDLGGTITLVGYDEKMVVHAAYGFDNQYQCGYDIWCSRGLIKTTRAFTAPPGFPAEVVVQNAEGIQSKTFPFDHFHSLLSHVAKSIEEHDYDCEYDECLVQARLMSEVRLITGKRS